VKASDGGVVRGHLVRCVGRSPMELFTRALIKIVYVTRLPFYEYDSFPVFAGCSAWYA